MRERWLIKFENGAGMGYDWTLVAFTEYQAQRLIELFPGGYIYDYQQD